MSANGFELPHHSPDSDSLDSVNLWIELEGDRTVRPCRPELLQQAMAERERIAKWGAFLTHDVRGETAEENAG